MEFLHGVVYQTDRITRYFRLDEGLGGGPMLSQHWHKMGYSNEVQFQQQDQKPASFLGWSSTSNEDQLGLILGPDCEWFLIHGSEHISLTQLNSLPPQNRMVSPMLPSKKDPCIALAWTMPWEKITRPGQMVPGSVKPFISENHCAGVCTCALALFM